MRSLEPCPGKQWLSPAAQSGEFRTTLSVDALEETQGPKPPGETQRKMQRFPDAVTQDDTQPVEGMKSLCSQTRNVKGCEACRQACLFNRRNVYASFPPRRLGMDFVNNLVVCATCVVRSHPNPPDFYISLSLSPHSLTPTRPSSSVLFVSQ